jgi:hypothetical protein
VRRTLVLAVLLASCAPQRLDAVRAPTGDPEGTWIAQLTYEENGCALERWPEGEVLASVPFVIARGPAGLGGTIGGGTGGVVALILGTNVFAGEYQRGRLALHLDGAWPIEIDGCAHRLGLDLDALIDGDQLTGTLRWVRRLPDAPACAPYVCESVQRVSAFRSDPVDAGVDGGEPLDGATEVPRDGG